MKGHVLVNVEGTVIEGEDGAFADLKLSVRDTGIGISKQQCTQVFQKFSQVDTSATRKHEGTGLGLSIASSLVELMGGEIGVESAVGQGSSFWFTAKLPVHGEIAANLDIPVDLRDARILIIDDNRINRSILTEQMSAWHFDHAATGSCKEGLDVMRVAVANSIELDLVILNCQMPSMSNAEVMHQMHADEALRRIPVVILNSVDSAQADQQLTKLGTQANLTKPIRSSVLLETILQVIANNRMSVVNSRSRHERIRRLG